MIRDDEEYWMTVREVRGAALKMPMEWGAVQNNAMDYRTNGIFGTKRLSDFRDKIKGLSKADKQYALRRWYIRRCSECDEWLFTKHKNVERNRNSKDKEWDFAINGDRFDLKGTRIPKNFSYDDVTQDPESLIKWLYEHQSKETRFGLQNRLFLIHHSFKDPLRNDLIRCAYKSKEKAINEFLLDYDNVKKFDYKGAKATILILYETKDGEIGKWWPRNDDSLDFEY
jgi:hypothetical protein